MGSIAKDVEAVACEEQCMYAMQMEKMTLVKNVLEVLLAEAVSRKALTPEEVGARLLAAPTNPGAADMRVVDHMLRLLAEVDHMLRLLAFRRVVRCHKDKDGKYLYSAGPVGKMTMMKNALEVLQAEAVSGKALTPEEVVARFHAAPTNPGAADMVVVESMLGLLDLLAACGVVRCQMEDKDGKYECWYSAGPVGKWLNPNEDGVSVAAPGNSLVAPGGYSLPFLGEPQGEAPFLGGRFMPPVRFMPPPAECVVDMESANKADGTGEAIPFAKSAFTRRDAGEPGNCGPEIFQANTTSDLEMGSNQPTSGDNANSAEVGSTAGSDPWQVSLIVAVLGGVTAAMGLVAAVLGLWKTSSSKKV